MSLLPLSDRIRWVRERSLGQSREAFCAAMEGRGVSVAAPTVYRYEAGDRTPDAEYIRALSELSGISTEWILKGADAEERTTPPAEELEALLGQIDGVLSQIRARWSLPLAAKSHAHPPARAIPADAFRAHPRPERAATNHHAPDPHDPEDGGASP